MDHVDQSAPPLGLDHARVSADDLDLRSARSLLKRMLLDTSVCACAGEAAEPVVQDAAEALGWCRPLTKSMQTAEREQVEREREAAAVRLRSEVRRATGGAELAVHLDPRNLHRCSDDWAQQCPMRPQWQCLRNRALEEAEQRAARAHSAIVRGVPADVAEAAAAGQLVHTEALSVARAMLEDDARRRLKFKRLLLFSSDDTGDGAVAAGYLLFKRGVGRYVSVPELRVTRHEDPLRGELMHHDVLALVDLPAPPPRAVPTAGHLSLTPAADMPRWLLELLESAIERVCRIRGKLVLTTRAHSADIIGQFGPRTQALFEKHGHVHPINPEAHR